MFRKCAHKAEKYRAVIFGKMKMRQHCFCIWIIREGFVMQKMSEKEKFIQMNKEAKATWIAGFIVMVFWWVSGFGIYKIWGSEWTILGIPAWVIISCFGSWILSIILVTFLVKKVFKDFDLKEEEHENGGGL